MPHIRDGFQKLEFLRREPRETDMFERVPRPVLPASTVLMTALATLAMALTGTTISAVLAPGANQSPPSRRCRARRVLKGGPGLFGFSYNRQFLEAIGSEPWQGLLTAEADLRRAAEAEARSTNQQTGIGLDRNAAANRLI